jgi:pimeloyl-ACP methyl ester carboxylesterase
MHERWRGWKSLVHDAVERVTDLVDEGNESTSRTVMRVIDVAAPSLGPPARAIDGLRRLGTRGVLGTVRAVNRAVEVITDVGIDAAAHSARFQGGDRGADVVPVSMRSDATRTLAWASDAALGLVNGAIGDHLHARGNGLDLGMSFRHAHRYLPLDPVGLRDALGDAGPKIVVFVHGLATTEWSWCLESEAYHGDAGASFGSLLASELGYTPIWARYNTGRHVSENGRLLADHLEALVRGYPRDVEELVLVGHSMGGLVVRSACHDATERALEWPTRVRRVFCLGAPHHGAPLERFGHLAARVLGAIDTPGTRIPARLIEARSAGVKDLGHGLLIDDDWLSHDPDALREVSAREIPLLDHATYHFLSATVTTDPAHPMGKLIGDLLVLVPSAHGELVKHRVFPIETRTFGGVLHHQLQNHPAVYAQIRSALSGEPLA